jgi:hypothetical protein
MSNRPFKTWTAAHGGSVIINAHQIVVVTPVANMVKITFANGGTESINATLSDFQSWLLGID